MHKAEKGKLIVYGAAWDRTSKTMFEGNGENLTREEAKKWVKAYLTWNWPSPWPGPGPMPGVGWGSADWCVVDENGERHSFISNRSFQKFLKQAYNL